MPKSSTAYVTCTLGGKTYTWHFTGVTSIEHNLALNLDNEAAQGEDIVNGAKNLSDQVSLQVIETDTEHTPGWSSAMLAVKRVVFPPECFLYRVPVGDIILTELFQFRFQFTYLPGSVPGQC